MSITRTAFRIARLLATLSALASGDSKRATRRGKNILVGRAFARLGIWRRLWK